MADRMQQLRLRQLDAALQAWKKRTPLPREGWVRTLRTALGMTLSDLATRLGITFQAVSQLEKSEQEGSVAISTLQAVADALECDLVYALVPRESLEAFLVGNARQHARRRVDRVQHSMSLEAQEISRKEIEHQIDDLTEELLAGNWRKIWKKA